MARAAVALFVEFDDMRTKIVLVPLFLRVLDDLYEKKRGVWSMLTMNRISWCRPTRSGRISLRKAFASLLTSTSVRVAWWVAQMFPHKARNGLQLGIEGLGAEGVVKQGRRLAGNKRVLHVDALLALGKHELKELHLDGPQSTHRAIENGLPVACLLLILDGSTDPGNFLVPPGKNLERHAKNLSGSAEGQIAVPPQVVALLQMHKLLDKGIPLADLVRSSPRRLEEDGARHHKRGRGSVFVKYRQFWGGGVVSMAHPACQKF
jgi:hypothetical protein